MNKNTMNKADILKDDACMAAEKGDVERAAALFREAAVAYSNLHDNNNHAECIFNEGVAISILGNTPEALERYERALALYKTEQDTETDQARCLDRIGALLGKVGHSEEALERWQQALKLYATIPGTETKQVVLLTKMGSASVILKRFGETLKYWERALKLLIEMPGTEERQDTLIRDINMALSAMKDSPEAPEWRYKVNELNRLVWESGRNLYSVMVLLRMWRSENKLDTSLVFVGDYKDYVFRTPDGTEIPGNHQEVAHFAFLGDMQIRFVIDTPSTAIHLSREEFEAFGLKPEEAVDIALNNIKRVYGKPRIGRGTDGLFQVEGDCPDYVSSYFLDREFWMGLSKQWPEGIVVSVPDRYSIQFCPHSDEIAVQKMRGEVHQRYENASKPVSSALYLFKDNAWTVFQNPTL